MKGLRDFLYLHHLYLLWKMITMSALRHLPVFDSVVGAAADASHALRTSAIPDKFAADVHSDILHRTVSHAFSAFSAILRAMLKLVILDIQCVVVALKHLAKQFPNFARFTVCEHLVFCDFISNFVNMRN